MAWENPPLFMAESAAMVPGLLKMEDLEFKKALFVNLRFPAEADLGGVRGDGAYFVRDLLELPRLGDLEAFFPKRDDLKRTYYVMP